jgi:micrococcal nuclease
VSVRLRLRLAVALAVLSSALSGCLTPGANDGLVLVTRVVDGDTVVIEDGRRVRYIGVDTPERGEDFYEEARQLNRRLVEGKRVRLERDLSDTDRFDRLLRYVYAGDTFVNAALVEAGVARARSYPPDVRYQAILEGAEGQAREERKGIWQSPRQLGRPYLSVLTSWATGLGGLAGVSMSSHLLNQSRTLRSTLSGFIVTLAPLSIPP